MLNSSLFHQNLGILKSLAKFDPPYPFSTHLHLHSRTLAVAGFNRLPLRNFPPLSGKVVASGEKISVSGALIQESSLQIHDEPPVSIELKSICSGDEFDKVIADAEQRNEPVIVVWMAQWCRKCIYLKPKLERLAADYYSRVQFYCVDVNLVSHKLVARAGVTKMPTIQLWMNGKKQDEVIGTHKAYLVVNEVQEMIESEFTFE